MPFMTRVRRPRSATTAKAWTERLEPLYAADHPACPGRFNTYQSYVAFLTAGAVEHHWTEGVRTGGRPPFVAVGRADDFLPELHKKMRAFRESRAIDDLASSELARHSTELLSFLDERIPSDELERFLAIARTYVMQNEHGCLSP